MSATSSLREARRTLWAALAVLALAVVYFWPVLAAEQFMAGDLLAEAYPFRRYVTQELFMGRLPHWTPYVGFGFPLLADPEATVFYPMSLLSSLLAGPGFSFRVLQWEMIVHYIVAALGMVLLGFRTKLGWAGALVGGCTFAFSGFLWAHGGHATVVQSASWLPWVLLGAAALLERPGARAAVATAAPLALSILGGHPQVAYYSALAFIIVLTVTAWPAGSAVAAAERRSGAWTLVRLVTLALALAGGFAAVQILPTAALTRESIRWARNEGFLLVDPFPPAHLLTVLVPFAFRGTPLQGSLSETHCYLGILPLVLAVWALARRRDRWTIAFAAVVAVGLLSALTVRPFGWVATAGYFRIPARALLLFDLGIAGLAARGADALFGLTASATTGERRLVHGLVVGVGLIGALAMSLVVVELPAGLGSSLARDFPGQFQRFVLWLAGATIVVLTARRLRRPAWAAPALILTLLAVEILAFPRDLVWSRHEPEHRWPTLPRISALGASGQPYRVGGDLYGFAHTMENNAGLVYRTPMGPIYSSLALRRTGPVFQLLERPVGLDTYRLVGIQWLTDSRLATQLASSAATAPALRRVDPRLWAVPDALPRAHLPAEVRMVPEHHDRMRALATLDPRRTVLVERPSAECPRRTFGAERAAVEFLADEPRRVLLRVRALEPGPLVLSDTYYLGWQATVDGRPVQIHHANYAFRMVCVPAGDRRVEFTFRQPGFELGLALTILSSAAAAALVAGPGALAFRPRVRRRVGTPAGTPSP